MIGVRELTAFTTAVLAAVAAACWTSRYGLLATSAAGAAGLVLGLSAGLLYHELVFDAFGGFATGLLKRNRLAGGVAVACWIVTILAAWAAGTVVVLSALRVALAHGR